MGSYSGQAALHHGGEPLLDPALPGKIALLRRAWPKADISFVSTLGVEVEEKWLESLWEKGLDDMEVSFYGYDRETYKDIHGVDGFELARKNLLHLLGSSARRAAGGTVCIRMLHVEENGPVNPRHYADNAARFRDALLSHAGVRAVDTYLSSHSGQGPIQRERATVLPCGVVWGLFRDRINVTWDMNVVPCCQDFDNNIVLGNLRHDSVEDIFSGPVYRDFFHAHWSGDLSAWPLCRNCERSVSGTRSQLTRIAVWKIANILQNSPQKDDTPFAVIGEPGLAGPAAAFFRRNFSAYRSLSSDGAALPADLDYVFLVARDSAQSAYYAETLERRRASACRAAIIPVIGVGYHVRTAVAEGLASIYAGLGRGEA
jgi:hypothetical protein